MSYTVDRSLMAERYLALQKQFHPDRYINKPAQEQRLAMQYTAAVNQAHTALKSPLLRAQYLLSLVGIDGFGETTVTQDVEFLMQQMALREELSEVSESVQPFDALEAITSEVESYFKTLQAEFSGQYESADYSSAAESVAKLQFYSKLLFEIEQLEHDLDEQ